MSEPTLSLDLGCRCHLCERVAIVRVENGRLVVDAPRHGKTLTTAGSLERIWHRYRRPWLSETLVRL